MANKHVIHYKKTGSFVRIFGIPSRFWISLLSDSFNRKKRKHKEFQREFRNRPIKKKKESFDNCKLVSSVIGGWARCAPSPTTRVAGHDVAAA